MQEPLPGFHGRLAPPLSSERDGNVWFESLLADAVETGSAMATWMSRLAGAEYAGYAVYDQLNRLNILTSSEHDHAERIHRQEFGHHKLVRSFGTNNLPVSWQKPTTYMPHEYTLKELDLNERRSLMRLTTIHEHPRTPPALRQMASLLIPDEVYHVWYTGMLVSKYVDLDIPGCWSDSGTGRVHVREGAWPEGRPTGLFETMEHGLCWRYA